MSIYDRPVFPPGTIGHRRCAFRDAKRKIQRAHALCDGMRLDEHRLSQEQEGALIAVEMPDEWQIRIGAVFLPPEDWPVTISEVLFHLRSALDHIAYQLAVAHSGNPLPEAVANASEFPIFRDPGKYDGPNGARRKLAGVAPSLWPTFRRLQPFPDQVRSIAPTLLDEVPMFLGLLHDLHRLEKHRFTPTVMHAALNASWDARQPEPVLEGGSDAPTGGLEPGDIIARCKKMDGYVPLTSGQPRFKVGPGVMLDGRFWNLPGSLIVAAMMVDRTFMALTGQSGGPCVTQAQLTAHRGSFDPR